MQHKRLIPFRLLPGSWGLAGKAFAEAEAYYLYDGEDLERRLLAIRHDHDSQALAQATLALDLKYGRITAYEHDCMRLALDGLAENARSKAEIDLRHGRISQYEFDLRIAAEVKTATGQSAIEHAHTVLDIDLRHGMMTKLAYDKAKADLDEKPWIGIVDQGFDLEKGVNGVYFEFDWNSYWIEYLRLNGYTGVSEETIVEHWFEDVCRATAEAPAHPGEPAGFAHPLPAQMRTSTRIRGTDGTFYS